MSYQVYKAKVYVAMSGGVDSSVAAALLKKQGFDVVGVFMRPWDPGVIGNSKTITSNSDKKLPVTSPSERTFVRAGYQLPVANCLWQQDREDAMRAAAVLGIPLLTWDFSKEYKKEVGDYMIREYKAGRTPNPDVMCNKEIKFGLFLKRALKEGADFIATGHYVRLVTKRGPASAHPQSAPQSALWGSPSRVTPFCYKLFMARDNNKDQSYFLWTLSQQQLKHCLFPIGDYTKPVVRKMAEKFGLPNHDKKDSQGVCFIGPLDMKDFLKKYIKPKRGNIVLHGHHVIGEHDGVYYYTIGQRHGLDIKNGQGPYYVTGKDFKKNIIYVGKKKDLGGKELKVSGINWVGQTRKFPANIEVKIRYRSESIPAKIRYHTTYYILHTTKPLRAITPGQSAVFYKKDELLGGGIII